MGKMLLIRAAAVAVALGAAGAAADAATPTSNFSLCATSRQAKQPRACHVSHADGYRHRRAAHWAVRAPVVSPIDGEPGYDGPIYGGPTVYGDSRYADPGYDHPGHVYGQAPVWSDVGLPEYITGDYSNYF